MSLSSTGCILIDGMEMETELNNVIIFTWPEVSMMQAHNQKQISGEM